MRACGTGGAAAPARVHPCSLRSLGITHGTASLEDGIAVGALVLLGARPSIAQRFIGPSSPPRKCASGSILAADRLGKALWVVISY